MWSEPDGPVDSTIGNEKGYNEDSDKLRPQEWWPPPLSEEEQALRRRAARLLESLHLIPVVYNNAKAWENEHEHVFAVFRRGCIDSANNGMLEAPIYNNRQIESAWLFLLEVWRKHPVRRKNVEECARLLAASHNWSMTLYGSVQVRTAIAKLSPEIQHEVLQATRALPVFLELGLWPSLPPQAPIEESPLFGAATAMNGMNPMEQERMEQAPMEQANMSAPPGWQNHPQYPAGDVWPNAPVGPTAAAGGRPPPYLAEQDPWQSGPNAWPQGADWATSGPDTLEQPMRPSNRNNPFGAPDMRATTAGKSSGRGGSASSTSRHSTPISHGSDGRNMQGGAYPPNPQGRGSSVPINSHRPTPISPDQDGTPRDMGRAPEMPQPWITNPHNPFSRNRGADGAQPNRGGEVGLTAQVASSAANAHAAASRLGASAAATSRRAGASVMPAADEAAAGSSRARKKAQAAMNNANSAGKLGVAAASARSTIPSVRMAF